MDYLAAWVQLKSERNEERVRYVASPRFLRFFPIRLENGSGSSEPIVAFCTGMKESEKRKKRQNHEAKNLKERAKTW